MIFSATDDGSRATIQTDDPASRRCAPDSRSVSAPNIGLAHPALALLLLAVLAAPVQAAVLVSNIGQTVSSTSQPIVGSGQDLHQAFTTGTGAATTLTSIEIKLRATTAGQAHPTVTLHSGSPTSAAVATLTAPSGTIGNGTANFTYTAPANTTLAASTTYYVVVEDSGTVFARTTSIDNEDSGGQTGWSIANGYGQRTGSSTGAFNIDGTYAMLIRVNGTATTTTCPAPDLGTGRTAVWTATMTVGAVATNTSVPSRFGFFTHEGTTYGSLSGGDSFTVGSGAYTVNQVRLRSDNAVNVHGTVDNVGTKELALRLDKLLADLDRADLQFHVCGASYTLIEASDQAQPPTYKWDPVDLDWTAGEIVTLRMSLPTAPGKPRNLAADGGDTQVTLTWTAPASAGAAAITHYQYRHAAGSAVPTNTSWTDVADGSDAGNSTADERSVAVSGLLAGTRYAFEVRAVNSLSESTGAGPVTATLGLRSCSSAPDLAGMGRTAVWTATMTVGERSVVTTPAYSLLGSFMSGGTTYGSLSDTSFTVNSRDYTIDGVQLREPAGGGNPRLSLALNKLLAGYDRADLQFHVCDASYALTGAAHQAQPPAYTWDPVVLDWTAGETITLRLSLPTAPSKPRNLAADGGDTQVTLTWTAPARAGTTAITHYQYRHAAGSAVPTDTAWTDVADGSDAGNSTADETSVAVSGLLAGTQYAFEVRAVNSGGESPVAGPVTATLGLRSCSSAPDLAGMGRTAVWTATMTVGERAFTTSPAYSLLGSFTSGGTTYGSLSGKSFTVGSRSYTVDGVQLREPAGVGNPRLSLALNRLLADLDRADLQFHVCDASYALTGAAHQAQPPAYTWDPVELDWTAGRSVILRLSVPTGPSEPRNLAADGGDTQVTLTWTAPARAGATAITHYQYRHAAGSAVPTNTSWTDVADGSDAGNSAADERSVVVSGLLAGTRYAFEVRAVNSGGESTGAGPVTATLGLRSCSSAPDLAGMGRTAVWTATMTVGERAFTTTPAYSLLGSFTSGGTTYGSLSGKSFTVGSRSYTVDGVQLREPAVDGDRKLTLQFNKLLAGLDRARLQFHVCDASYALMGGRAAQSMGARSYVWDPVEIDWTAGRSVILRLSVPTAAVPSALVSNWEQAGDKATSSGTSRVQRFTTGSNTDGYTLSSIGVISEDAEDDAFSATVCPVNAQGYPPSPPATVAADTSCWALTPPGDFSPGLLTFTASGSVALAASTTYTVVFRPASGSVKFDATSSPAEDSGSLVAWSIYNGYDFYSSSASAYRTTSSGTTVRIAVRGREGTDPTAPGAPQNLAAEAVDTQATLIWTAPASDGGAAITKYRYRYSTGTTVSASAMWADVPDGSDAGDSTADETSVTVSSLVNGTEYAFEVLAVNSVGDGTAAGPVTATPARLEVTGVAVSSTPSGSGTYGAGETISFKATFSGAVTVTGTPQFAFSLGGTTKQAALASGSDSTELVFSYTVAAGDNDADGVSWAADALSLNGGTIKFMTSVVANRVDAALTHAAGDAQSGHKVDTPPRLEERTVDGAALTLTYSETLDANSRPAASAFAVTVGGATAPLASGNSVTVSGTTVTLTLATALTAQDTNVRVSYVKPTSNPIQDAGGTDAAAFSNQVVSNRTTDGPTLSAAEVDGTGLVLTFSDPLNTASAPASAAFTVKVGGSAVTQASSGPVAIAGSAVTLTLATAVAASDTVTVSYAVPQTNPLRGTDDLDAAAFDDRPVTNRTIAVPDAPDSFRVTAGDAQAELSWAAPSFDGNSPITKYRYRYAAGTTVPTTRAWTDVPDSNNDNSLADERAVTVTGLTNETEYAFEIQAVNSAGGGPEASASATPVEDPNLPSVVLELRAQTGDATVTLEWGPPLRTGSHGSIDYYEYRYAAGSSVPTSTSWASADEGRYPFAQITGLENGRSYAFEVRAVNKHGYKGPVATLTARPHARVVQTLPTAPRGLRGDGSLYEEGGRTYSSVTERAQVKFSWEAPSNLGNSHLIRYEYRYAARGESLSSSAWNHGPASERTLTVRNLVAGTSYTFQLRAVTLAGAGRAASVGVTTPRSERLSLSVFTRGSAVEGENLTIGVRRSGTPNKAVLVVVDIHDSTTGRWSAKSVDIAAGAREGTVEFAVPFDGERGAARELEVTLGPGSWKPESAYRVGSPASATVRVRNRDALLRVRDATVREGPQAVLRFDVSLDRAVPGRVTVDYATSDVTATAGADYTATSDTLSFAAGEVSKTVSVAVLDDAHDEGTETLTLTLSNARGAAIDDGTATGRIINTDAMPKAWLARFGRTASDHAIQAIESRLHGDGSAQTQSHLTIGGRRVDTFFDRGRRDAPMNGRPDTPDPRPEPEPAGARADRPEAEALGPADVGGADGDPADGGLSGSGSAWRRLASLLGLPDLDRGLMGSSFLYSSRADGGHAPGWLGQWSAWGQTAETRFDGADGRLSLHGEVATATVGFETRRERWLAGVAVSHSEGEGAYAQANAGGGTVTSELTNVAPFARYDLSDRVSLWGALGYGAGGLSLTPKRADAAIETGLTNAMAAFGARTALTALSWRAGRFELSALSDARVTSTRSETAHNLMGAAGLTSRVRVLLAGAGSMPLANGGALRPTLEAGLRHDGGDAETGAGVELGVGLGYAAGRFSLQVDARGLLAHQDTEYGEWGFSGSASYAAGDAGRGLRLDLGSARGATQSGVDSLWNSQDASGLARGVAMDAGQRLNAKLAYGLPGPRGRALWTPYVGANADGGQQALRVGVKLSSGPNVEAGLEIGRRLAPLKAPEHAIRLGVSMRW